jgi:hypothetical protein
MHQTMQVRCANLLVVAFFTRYGSENKWHVRAKHDSDDIRFSISRWHHRHPALSDHGHFPSWQLGFDRLLDIVDFIVEMSLRSSGNV